MIRYPILGYVVMIFMATACVSAQETARRRAVEAASRLQADNYCPSYGALSTSTSYWPVWKNTESNELSIELKNREGQIISLPFKEATEAKKIDRKTGLEAYLSNYRALCGEERPPFFYDIYFVEKDFESQLSLQIEKFSRDNGKVYLLKKGSLFGEDENSPFREALWDGRLYSGFDNTIIKGDEFTYQENKRRYDDIRSHKYFLVPASMTRSGFDVIFSDYDFAKEGFLIKFRMQQDTGQFYGRGGYSYTIYESNEVFLPVVKEEAKLIRSNQEYRRGFLRRLGFIVTIDRAPTVQRKVIACDLGIGTMIVTPERYTSDRNEFDSKCSTVKNKIDNLRTLQFKIIKMALAEI